MFAPHTPGCLHPTIPEMKLHFVQVRATFKCWKWQLLPLKTFAARASKRTAAGVNKHTAQTQRRPTQARLIHRGRRTFDPELLGANRPERKFKTQRADI